VPLVAGSLQCRTQQTFVAQAESAAEPAKL